MERIQGSPRVASECLNVSLQMSPHKVVSLWVLIEWRRPRVSLMRVMGTVGLQGVAMLMALMKNLKAMICIQCHVTPIKGYMIRYRKV